MSIIRTDNQADGVEILKLVVETTDYYREMSNVMEDHEFATRLENIADERATFIGPFRELVKELGELPAQPDPDKELMQKVGGELTKFLSADSNNAILDKCLHEDEKLAEGIKHTRLGEKSADFHKLLSALAKNISDTKAKVQAMKN